MAMPESPDALSPPQAEAAPEFAAPEPAFEDAPSEPLAAPSEVAPPAPEAVPPPIAPRPTSGRRRSPAVVIGVVAVAVVIAAGVFVGLSKGWFGGTPSGQPSALPTSVQAPPSVATGSRVGTPPAPSTAAVAAPPPSTGAPATPSAIPSASAAASASASPTSSAAPSAPASAAPQSSASAAPATDGDPSALPPNHGYVIVNAATPSSVYLNGILAGPTGQRLEVECGTKYARLATLLPEGNAKPSVPIWVSDGRSAKIVCRSLTTISLEIKPQQ